MMTDRLKDEENGMVKTTTTTTMMMMMMMKITLCYAEDNVQRH